MKEKLSGMPGVAAHIFSTVFALLLTVCLLATAVLWLADDVLLNEGLHKGIASSDDVVDAQMARIESDVSALADRYFFDAGRVMPLITRESVVQYGSDVTAWWMGLIAPNAELSAPAWQCEGLEEIIREDPLFQAQTPTGQQKSIARDKAAAGVASAVGNAVLPIRAQLIPFALSQVSAYAKVTAYAAYLPYLPIAAALLSLVLCGLICLCMSRRLIKALPYIGAALAAAAIGLGGILLAVKLMGLTGMVAEVSPLLSLQLSKLLHSLALRSGIAGGIALLVGLTLIGIHQRSMYHLRRSLAKVNMEV